LTAAVDGGKQAAKFQDRFLLSAVITTIESIFIYFFPI
jgi:hypothetical protein